MSNGRGCLVIFGLPFAVVGVFAYGMILWLVFQFVQTSTWPTASAELLDVTLDEHTDSEGATSVKPVAKYRYFVNGQEFNGERVALVNMSDNIGSFQYDLGWKLKRALQAQQPVECFYNPGDPASSVLNREIRYELLVFLSVFALFFGIIGLALVIGGAFARFDDDTLNEPKRDFESNSPQSIPIANAVFIYAMVLALPLGALLPNQLLLRSYGSAVAGAVMLLILVLLARECLRVRSNLLRFGKSRLHVKKLSTVGNNAVFEGTVMTERSGGVTTLPLEAKFTCVEGSSGDENPDILVDLKEIVHAQAQPGAGLSIPISFKFQTPARIADKMQLPKKIEFRLDLKCKNRVDRFKTGFVIKGVYANR